jgi:hypothetical protein
MTLLQPLPWTTHEEEKENLIHELSRAKAAAVSCLQVGKTIEEEKENLLFSTPALSCLQIQLLSVSCHPSISLLSPLICLGFLGLKKIKLNIFHLSEFFIIFLINISGTRRKPQILCKSLTNYITYCCIQYTSPERGSNSQL